MSTTRHLRTLTALAALLLAAQAARAGELAVSPILVELSSRAPTALLSVRNEGASPVRVQLRAFAWSQDARGEMNLAPTDAVIVYPPLLELAPGASRNVRLGTHAVAGPVERSFRIFVEELPGAASGAGEPAVRVLTRIGIPIFVTPVEPKARAELAVTGDGRRVQFTLRNTGTVRVRPTQVRAAIRGEDDRALQAREEKAWYVLAGEVREYEVEVPPELCATTRRVELTVVLDRETLTASVPVAPEACRP